MRVVPPLEITDARLTSSSVAEPYAPAAYSGGTTYAEHAIVTVVAGARNYESLAGSNIGHTPSTSPAWWREIGAVETAYNAGSTYAEGDTVSSTATHRVYESLQAGNVGNPLPIAPETATDYWLDIGPTNRWRMFDLYRNTQVVGPSPLTVVLTPEARVDSIGLTDLDATSVTVSMVVSAVTVYTRTIDLSSRDVASWYEFFFAPFNTKTAVALFDLPPYYTGAVITVAVTNGGGNVRVGGLTLGLWKYLGLTERDVGFRRAQFSKITRDEFAVATLVPRPSIPTTEQRLLVNAASVRAVDNTLVDLDAVPALYSALDDEDHILFEPLLINGIYRDADWTISEDVCILRLTLEEI